MTLARACGPPCGRGRSRPAPGCRRWSARVAWQRPRRPRIRDDQVAWTVTEARSLGVTGLGGLTSYARVLLDGDDPTAALAALLPEPVDHVLIQADLTAVAPGPLESALARQLQLVADVESRGGATVYRFTPGSVRRALDVGWSAAELHGFLDSVSRTPVPQPLSYLVDDTVRKFGTVRVGHAEAFLRSDDETALAELLHHPQAGTLGLRRIAPTVLVSTLPLDVLLPRLRELGAAPVVEAADGTVRVLRPDVLRARGPKPRRAAPEAARESARVAAAVTAIRSGERATAARPTAATPLTPERIAGRPPGGDRGRHRGAHRVRRQPRHRHRSCRRPALGRGRRAHRPRPPRRRRTPVRHPPDHHGPPAGVDSVGTLRRRRSKRASRGACDGKARRAGMLGARRATATPPACVHRVAQPDGPSSVP